MIKRFRVGSIVEMNDDAIDNYGEKYRDKKFKITHVATKYMPSSEFFAKGKPSGYHPGFDDVGSALYDLDGLNVPLYDWELKPAKMRR